MTYAAAAFGQRTFGQFARFDSLEDSSASRAAAFNFCDPFDHVLPIPDGTVGRTDRAHLWGFYSGIPITGPVGAGAADRLSAFNFCDPFDHILPPVDGAVSNLDRAHLWGLFSGIAVAGAAAPSRVAHNLVYAMNQMLNK